MSAALRVRLSTPGDLAWITTLERAHKGGIGQWTEAEHLAAMGAADRGHCIIEDGASGRPLGYLIAFDTAAATGGVYLKRILVSEKGRGTGTTLLRLWLEDVFARPGTGFVWLHVHEWNVRAQALYGELGFARWEPEGDARSRCDEAAEPPAARAFRMRLDRPPHSA